MLVRENHLFGCARLKPSQGSVPFALNLTSDLGICFQCQAGSSLVLRRPLEITALIGNWPTTRHAPPLTPLRALCYFETFLIEERKPPVTKPQFPRRFGGLSEKGTAFNSAEVVAGSSLRDGWGARLIPAHCHPLKNGWSAIGKKAASTSLAALLFLPPSFLHRKTQERGRTLSAHPDSGD